MKRLVDAFLELSTWQGVALIAAAVALVVVVALIVSKLSFRAGQRFAEGRQTHLSTKRRDLESIV
jgi:hypothetical protein